MSAATGPRDGADMALGAVHVGPIREYTAADRAALPAIRATDVASIRSATTLESLDLRTAEALSTAAVWIVQDEVAQAHALLLAAHHVRVTRRAELIAQAQA